MAENQVGGLRRASAFVTTVVLSLGLLQTAQAAQTQLTGTATRVTVAVPGKNIQQRNFIEYVPRNLKPGAPLLFAFHGSGGDGANMRESTAYEFDRLADAQGFVVLYPEGFQNTWNDCRKGSPQPARQLNIDDEVFAEAMIAKEFAAHGIDRKRVFSMGWSNGGQLGYRFALERANLFAGVAAISASLPLPANLACTPSGAAMPVMIINGTEDPINPFDGGDVMLGFTNLGPVYSSRETGQYWAKLNGITSAPEMKTLPHKVAADPSHVQSFTWSKEGKPTVVLYAVQGGGHVVPTGTPQMWGGLGLATGDLDAPAVIWDFFSKLPSKP